MRWLLPVPCHSVRSSAIWIFPIGRALTHGRIRQRELTTFWQSLVLRAQRLLVIRLEQGLRSNTCCAIQSALTDLS